MQEFSVIGFGALNLDRLFKVDDIAKKDEESFVRDIQEFCGGSAANTMVGLARLGIKTGFIGKVADDREGKIMIQNLKDEGVNTDNITIQKKGRSGIVMGFVDKHGERALYVDSGINDVIDFSEINMEYLEKTEFLHLTSFVGEKSFESQIKTIRSLPEKVKVSFDPGMLYVKKGLQIMRPIIQNTFVLFLNKNESKILTGKKIEESANELIDEGVKIVGIKLGSKGCFLTDGYKSHFVKPFKVNPVDTTGAGDAWNAGFIYGVLHRKDLNDCGRIGNYIAGQSILKRGARDGLPNSKDLQKVGLL